MIELIRTVNTKFILKYLERYVKDELTPDHSNYAKGRLRGWIGPEPALYPPFALREGLQHPRLLETLRRAINWDFQYCLVTYSGDVGTQPIGIKPHRDAGYADYEAYSLNVSGSCRFRYWNGRPAFGFAHNTKEYNPHSDAPTHVLDLKDGDISHFNCKNLHSAEPMAERWAFNFWRMK